MDGNSFVFCDGKHWNGTKPECLGRDLFAFEHEN
jgi:hypothetical protein